MSGIATYPVGSSWNFGQHPKLLLFNYLNIESPRIFCFISLLYREPLRLSSYSLRVLHSLIEAAIAWLQLPSHRSPHIYHPFCPVHFPTVTREHSNSEHSNSMIHSFRQFLRSSQRSGLIWGIGMQDWSLLLELAYHLLACVILGQVTYLTFASVLCCFKNGANNVT